MQTDGAELAVAAAQFAPSDDADANLKIGREMILTVSNKTKKMTVKQDGKVIKTIPVSLGKSSTPSSSGTMVVMEKAAHTVFDYSVPAQSFPTALSYVALGHLHRHQRMPAAAPVWYSGSPMQLDFGEIDDHKGVLLAEAEPGVPARVEFRRLRSGRKLHVLSGTLEQIEAAAAEIDPEDYVRVILDEPARAGLADEVRQVVPQAVDVVLDPSRRPSPARHRVRAGRSHTELFEEYLRERDAHDERVVALFTELLGEAHEA